MAPSVPDAEHCRIAIRISSVVYSENCVAFRNHPTVYPEEQREYHRTLHTCFTTFLSLRDQIFSYCADRAEMAIKSHSQLNFLFSNMMPLRLDFIADRGTTLPRAVYVCIAIEFFANLGSAINTVPITRLIEGAVCQRFYNSEVLLAEELCKSDGVQTDMAYLLGAMASFGSVPNLILTIPYGILSEHVDRRLILLANSVSAICKLLFNTAVCKSELRF